MVEKNKGEIAEMGVTTLVDDLQISYDQQRNFDITFSGQACMA